MAGSTAALPPSVEKAYYRKCIDLRRRINEIEEHNDATRLRIKRLNRSVLKMRLERAFLLEQLQQRMDYNVDGSDESTSPPRTVRPPQEKPLRSKRSHRKATPTGGAPASSQHGASPPPSSSHPHTTARQQPPSSQRSTPEATYYNPTGTSRSTLFAGGANESVVSNGTPSRRGAEPTQSSDRPSSAYPYAPASGDRFERRSTSAAQENGGEFGRAYPPGATGETVGADPSTRTDANGERRVAPDTDMADSGEPAGPREGSGGAAGFTAVNR